MTVRQHATTGGTVDPQTRAEVSVGCQIRAVRNWDQIRDQIGSQIQHGQGQTAMQEGGQQWLASWWI